MSFNVMCSLSQRVMAFNACRRQFLGGLTGMSLAAGGYYAGTNHERIKKFYRVQVCAYAAAPTELQNVHLTMCIALLKLPPAVTPTLQLPSSAGVLMKNRASEIMRFGYPGFDNLRTYEDYVLSYDQRNRTAHWVMEHLTPDRMKYDPSVDRAKCSFKEDDTIHPYFRSRNQDYKGSGFDRGHMAPAGNHRRTQNAINQTFLLSNMTPQVGSGFNRDKWNELEKLVRKLSRHHANVYICTGPLYLPGVGPDGNTYVTYRVIGHSHVAVPTHFFKVVLYEVAPNTYELESWVLPNQAIPDQTPLYNFRVPIDSIERSAGFILFEKLNKNSIRKINGLDNRKFLK